MPETPIKPRANYLVNPPFQWLIIRWALMVSLLNSAVFALTGLAFFQRLVEAGIRLGIAPDAPYFQALMNEKARLILALGLTTFISTCVILGFGIFISHRIAGPIHHLSRYLKEYSPDRPLPDLKFRKKDFFQDLASDFNVFKSKIGPKSEDPSLSIRAPKR